MRILVVQHHTAEHPGVFRDFMAEDGVDWDAVQVQEGEALPALDAYDALWVMGGPQDVWQEDEHPWLVPEKRLIHEAVFERNLPFLGCCLGHQLLGEVAGGRCGAMDTAEVGVRDVALSGEGHDDRLLQGIESQFKALQWHGAEVIEVPREVAVLARSAACAIEAIRVGDRAWGLQYHVEVTENTVGEWAAIPAYAEALEQALGANALPDLEAETRANIEAFNRDARTLYRNFMAIVGA
ncbi:MAG: type 1 glutamine amidotransferase [Halofilum sp. (in: g-proteobacteria)]